jgi:hypothetical protein
MSTITIEHRLSVLETHVEYIRETQGLLLTKLDSLQSFKYFLMGGAGIISFVISCICNLGVK